MIMTLKDRQHLSYVDKNNLYGWAMSEYLPYEECKWLKKMMNLM